MFLSWNKSNLSFLLWLLIFHIQSCHCMTNSNWYNWFEDNKNDDSVFEGILPTLLCPTGHYRQFKYKDLPHLPGGYRRDGCLKCPKGVYGNSTDLKSSNCTAPCPKGTYNDRMGATGFEQCLPCPVGTYGSEEGLTNNQCSGKCADIGRNGSLIEREYYSDREGLTSPDECKVCPSNFYSYNCNRKNVRDELNWNDWDRINAEHKYNFSDMARKLQLPIKDDYQYVFTYMEVVYMLQNRTFFVSKEYLERKEPLWWCTDPACRVKPWDHVKYEHRSSVFE